jgi:hypothetical protein
MHVHPRRLACFRLLTVAVLAASVARAGDPAPRIVVDAAVHDFGAVEQGTVVEHVFRLRNAGSAPFHVDHVKGTCACTVGVATGEAVEPGNEAWVTVRLETARLAGRTTKTATVYTNDPETPTVAVTLTGQVVTDVVVHPAPLYVGRIRQGAVVRRELLVTSGRPEATASVVGVDVTNPHLKAWVEPAAAGAGQRVVVEVTADMSLGRFNDEIVLRTTSARQPTVTVKVFGTIEDDGTARLGQTPSVRLAAVRHHHTPRA